jgi:hypothetical protein
MPLFEMKAMIDTLTLYTHRSLDLTEKYHRILAYGAPKLCLDAGWDYISSATNVVKLGQCNGGNSQQWVYNRTVLNPRGVPDTVMSDTISSPVSGLCLDIADNLFMNRAFQIKAWKSAVPGMVAELSHCTGHDSQKWTYNRVTHVLQNKLGTVLDIQWNNLQAGTLVWSWPLNGGRAQQWRAD